MAESVVSSHYGKRPILEVPALQISGQNMSSSTVPYMNNSAAPPFVHNAYPGVAAYPPRPTYHPPDAYPQQRMGYPGINRTIHSAPTGSFYNNQGPRYPWGPSNEAQYPNPFHHPQFPGPASHFPPEYAPAPRHAPARNPHPNLGFVGPGFNITCELEYGRIMNIDVRDTAGEFLGVPPFLRAELMRTYGSYPYTKVKVRQEAGEFHIYSTHEGRRRQRGPKRGRDVYTAGDSRFDDDYEDDDRGDPFPDGSSEYDFGPRRINNKNRWARPRGVIHERH